ncbi:efflux transporter outer membrane subunit [Yersinia enterocolitica]|nr:efflux transporter outer membrane subunit [Yersinia enterocolitica]MCG9158141.1 efflux transporter outer membrane subunit [Yersinia enterocolitica]MCG9169932.1 efflux transporter outer membrane subunit [Yersinia enterocolitica]MCG9181786.1 efflux transporter outer membrane subunit [Yersinia enterocolitica]MCG9185834.1 efflux transporter outer membrane subunit [Yersinia enterocolitica]MCG9189879.1 efflux transporter outer membrane subunit [Yersinia enterocolitica]
MRSKIILACLVFTLAACDQSSSPSATPSLKEVGGVTLKTEPVTLSSDLSGRTVAVMASGVRPQVDGIIKTRLFTEGAEVSAGQVLYQIDPASYLAAYDTAKAALQNVQVSVKSARLKAQRYVVLAKENGVSQQDADDAQTSYQQALANVAEKTAALETLYQSARADVAQYKTTVAQDKNALDLLVGQSVPTNLLPTAVATLPQVIKAVPVGLSSDVLLNRPDVLATEHKLKSANANIGAARAAFFPSVTLTASGGVGSSALSTLLSEGAGIWSFAPAITLPIFDGGANQAALDYSQAQKNGYIAAYEKAIQTAFKEVADALARKATIQEQLAAQQAYVAAAQESFELAQKRYKQGIDTYLNMLDAQRTLYSAQASLITEQQTQANNMITLYKVLGGGISDASKD